MLDQLAAEQIEGGVDPALIDEMAYLTAEVVVYRGRAEGDPEVLDRLVTLVDREGIEAVAHLWATAPATTLAGALWRMYLLREWVRSKPDVFALHYRLGSEHAQVAHVVAGVAHPPLPDDVVVLADQVLSGLFVGELDVALVRAAAFCRVVAVGATHDADSIDGFGVRSFETPADAGSGNHATSGNHASRVQAQTRHLVEAARSLAVMASELEEAGTLWRRNRLD